MNTETEEAEGDNTSIHCPCGKEWHFETADGEPEKGTRVECNCGRVLTVTVVDWSAYVCASVKPPPGPERQTPRVSCPELCDSEPCREAGRCQG